MNISAKVTGASHVTYRFPGAWHKFKAYYHRFSMEHYAGIIMPKTLAIFLPTGTNVFKIIENKVKY